MASGPKTVRKKRGALLPEDELIKKKTGAGFRIGSEENKIRRKKNGV